MFKCRFLARALIERHQQHSHAHAVHLAKHLFPPSLCRSFSAAAAAERGETQAPTANAPSIVYGRLSSIGKYCTKKDIMNMFAGCNLNPESVRFAYSVTFNPIGTILQLPSRDAYNQAFRLIGFKARHLRLQEANKQEWDRFDTGYDGRVLALQGVPVNALSDDIERCFPGYNLGPSDIRFVIRGGRAGVVSDEKPIRFALVKFPTMMDALNAMRERNKSFCLNNPIIMRLLQ